MSLNIFKKESYIEELQMKCKCDAYKKAILEMTGPDFDLDMIINSKNFFWTIKSLNDITYEDAQQNVKSFTYGQQSMIDGSAFLMLKKYVESYIYLNYNSDEVLYFDHFGGFIILNISSIHDGQIVTIYANKEDMGVLIGKQGNHIEHLTASVKQKLDMEKVDKKFRYFKAKEIQGE
jgi:predicted RNA-binding protein YlqC (UPF0109 family)